VLLEIDLAGHVSHWTFRGSRTFNGWADARPWLHEGGLCVVRLESADVVNLVIPSICRAVHGANNGDSRLDIRRVEVGSHAGTPVEALLREFELDPAISPFEARDRIRSCLLDRSILLIFVETAPVSPNDWEEIVSLLEYYRKSTKPVRLCAVIVDICGTVLSEPICDFQIGRPTHHVLADVSAATSENALWSAYLHHRAAWEAGGCLGSAMALGAELDQCSLEDDEAVEVALQAYAKNRFSSHFKRQQLIELAGLGADGTRPDPDRLKSLQADLFAEKLLWRPPAMNSLHVVPWAARALLGSPGLASRQVWALRHHLVCAPLAGEILSLCLKFESQIQTKLHGRQDRSKITDGALENQERFKSGKDDFVVYPRAFPAHPNKDSDVWAFASLGESLRSCPSGAVSDPYRDTLKLRNAVAHGHYVSWHHIRKAVRLLSYFDTSI
jgi:hypothetical protein